MGDFRGNLHPVELGVGFGNALHDLAGFCNGRFSHGNRLEPPLQGCVLLNMLAVLGKGGSADDLNFTPRQGGLQDIGSVHRAFRIACAHQIVDFIDDQNDVAALLDLADQAFHTAFELAAELGTCHQGSQIQQEHFLIPELVGHFPGGNALGQALGDGSLTHTGFTDETGVVLLAAVQDLNDPLRLHIPADDLIELAFPCSAGQVHAVAVQEFVLLVFLLFAAFFFIRLLLLGRTGRLGRQIALAAAKQLVQQRKGCGLAVDFVILAITVVALTEHIAHFIRQQVQVILGNAHLPHGLVDLRNPQTPGAFQAVAFIHGHAVFHLGNEYNGYIFSALGAHFGLQANHSFCRSIAYWSLK